jgi:hypothetical protein
MNNTSAAAASTQAVFPSILTLPVIGAKLRVTFKTGCLLDVTSSFPQDEVDGVFRTACNW